MVGVAVLLGCQFPLRLMVANATDAPATLEIRFVGDGYCGARPAELSYMPVEHATRRFRDPELRRADQVVFDDASCTFRGVVPPRTALEIELPSLVRYRLGKRDLRGELSIDGVAGLVTFTGDQLYRHVQQRGSKWILEYRRADPP